MTSASFTTELLAAIAAAYEAFGTPLRPGMQACPCCARTSAVAALYAADRAHLPAASLGHYARKAMTTWGEVDDYRYFLPRILELAASNDSEFDLDILVGKLEYGHYETWPPEERAAVHRYFDALWGDTLVHPMNRAPEDVLLAAARVCGGLGGLLDRLAESPSMEATFVLASLVRDVAVPVLQGTGAPGGWREHPEREQLVGRLVTTAVRARIEEAFLERPDSEYGDVLAEAADLLNLVLPA